MSVRAAGHTQFPVVKLVDDFEAQWEVVANEGHSFALMTNLDAPRYRSPLACATCKPSFVKRTIC